MSRPFGYAAVLLANEHQEPMTAAEHANAHGHTAEFIRDVPSSCTGAWTWRPHTAKYTLLGHSGPCPWHANAGG